MKADGIHSKVWRGRYKDIHYEICTHMLDAEDGPWWNTYIILNNRYNPNYLKHLWVRRYQKYTRYNGKIHRYQEPKDGLRNLSWNGGQTFYEQTNDKEHDFKSIKIGDDYQHSWDYERGRWHLSEAYLIKRCEIMIDELIRHMDKMGISEEKKNDSNNG